MLNKFIEIMAQERKFILKTCFVGSILFGLGTVILRILYISPELRELYIIREYILSFMVVYFLNELIKLQDSERTETKDGL